MFLFDKWKKILKFEDSFSIHDVLSYFSDELVIHNEPSNQTVTV